MRFYDVVGYESAGENINGVWTGGIVERPYFGDVVEATRSMNPSDKVNDDIRLQNRIRIVADAFALENFSDIKYAQWNGVRWMVTTVTVQRPRLVLTLGGVWDGRIAED